MKHDEIICDGAGSPIDPTELDDDGDYIHMSINITTADGVTRTATMYLPDQCGDAALADALIACVRGVASSYGTDLSLEVAKRMSW